jgi:P2-related tail formation protein
VRLALPIAAAAVLLAFPTPATAAQGVSSWSSSRVVPAAGHVQATVLTAHPAQARSKSSPALPTRFMHPAELRTAKAKAAAGVQPAPSHPAKSAAPKSAAIFNGLNQPGLSAADEGSGSTPPDSTGAIGPTRYVEMVNQLVGVYDRSNLTLLSSTPLGSFVGAPAGVATSDPQIQWDPQGNRWLYAEIGFATGNNYLVFGWSKTADPSDLANGWCHYGIATGSMLQDYPKLGHDAHFLIVGSNVYDDSQSGFPFVTANLWAIPKPAANDSTCSSPVTATYFADATHPLKNTDGTLAFTPVPGNASDNVANDYIFGAHDVTLAPQSKVMVWHMASNPNPVLMADGDVSVGTFAIPAAVPQPGTPYLIDSLDGRLTQAVAHFDAGIGAEAYWTQQTVAGAGGRSIVRWYEFAPSLVSPIAQQGQVSSATDFIWNAAISPSIGGRDAVISYSRGSASLLAVAGAQSRTSATPLGQMDPGEVLVGSSSAAVQENAFQGNCTSAPCRWGDYSGATPDPVNAGVVWASNQLTGQVFLGYAQWTTRNFAITTGASAGPDFNLAVSPASQAINAGGSTSYTVSVNRTGGFTGTVALTLAGLPTGASASFNPASVSGSTSTLTVKTSASTPASSSQLTITGTSGALVRTTSATLVVQAPDFSLSASPSSQSVPQGLGAAYTITVSRIAGFSGSVTLSSSGLPSGAGATFSPNPASTSSTMSVTTSATTPAGTYTVTVNGVSGSLNHTTSVALVVSSGPCSTPTLTTSGASPYASGGGPITLTGSGQCAGGTQFEFEWRDLSNNWHILGSGYTSSNTAVWNADYQSGNYALEVDLRPVGSNAAWVTYFDQPFSLSGCGVPGLTSDLASPQAPRTTVHWTASVTCSGTPQYEFYVRAGGVWSIVQPWGGANTFTWNSPSTEGAYVVEVDVRNAGANEDPYDNYTDINYSLNSCNTPTLTTSAGSPHASGAGAITLTATGQCSGGTQFEFFYRDLSNSWHVIGSGYGSSNTAVWNADYAAGNYMLEVDIRPVGSSVAWDTYYDLPFTLSGCGTATLTPDLPSPQYPGTTVHWTASVTCSGVPQYEFYVRTGGAWSIVQPWGASNTFTWNSPSTAGAYAVEVDVRNAGANEDQYDSYTDVNYSLLTCNTPSLSTSGASPYASGSGPITLTASGQCGGGTQFEFEWRDLHNVWHVLGNGYGSSNTAVWNADYRAGNYILEVDIRPVGSNVPWVTYYDLPFTLSGCGVPSLTSDVASPQTAGTTVHWTASASCSGTPQYLFYVRAGGVWTIAQNWGASNTFTWTSPTTPGSYVVEVEVRNTGANEDDYDNYTDVPYNLS